MLLGLAVAVVIVAAEATTIVPGQLRRFPDLVGQTGEEAKAAILADFPDYNVEIVPPGTPVTLDLRPQRVRVYVDEDGIVDGVPFEG